MKHTMYILFMIYKAQGCLADGYFKNDIFNARLVFK